MRLLLIFIFTLACTPVFAANFYENVAIVTSGSMGASSVTSSAFDAKLCDNVSVAAVWGTGGSPVGTFKMQVSNDSAVRAASAVSTSWIDYSGSSQAISADGNFGWSFPSFGYRLIRLVYTRTSGGATLNANVFCKGVKKDAP